MKKQITLLVLAALFITQSSFAWGKKGHALVAEIAFTYLDPSVQTIVTKYLNGRSIQDAANWMDELRDDHSYDYLKPYHYVNFDKGVKVVNHEGDNIIFRLTQTIQELKKLQKPLRRRRKNENLHHFSLSGRFAPTAACWLWY